MKKPSLSREIMTLAETGEYLRVSTTYLYDRVAKNEIPFTRLPSANRGKGDIRFSRKALDEWIADRMVYSPEDEAKLLSGRVAA